ncbi:long-chain acyl-CoA synthetase [Capronia epimyces CBS 606.96]|uniref:Long-chain acyl-CoA synthetase n=1 Tax=Capronia epimyces CBS 606.96 TaxID=1182542 RepID=W9YJ78_9EURO|nr:long-chain acyl-CoA synthetase [Capronia epimyces CBS 606.96]EXJ89306.1 long-chain acyl-CoA synthetase [Capronia epimyces CBS 606.96]
MPTHTNLLNNGRFVGSRMGLTSNDVVCCPPPLFHCFELRARKHDCLSKQFDADRVLDAIVQEDCTSLYGVPTMFIAVIEAQKR